MNQSYTGGDVITFSGSATDAEDGILSNSSFVWKLDFHHNDHAHPSGTIAQGTNQGQFVISYVGEFAHDVFYTLSLEVTDSKGQKNIKTVELIPNLIELNFETVPSPIYKKYKYGARR